MKKKWGALKREGCIIEGIYLNFNSSKRLYARSLYSYYIIYNRKSNDIKKAMAFTGNRSKSSIGISLFKVKRLFSG